MVKSVEGKIAHVVRAYDGEPIDLPCPDVVGTSNEVEGLLDHDKDLASWKEMTLDGYSSKFLVPGKFHPMLTLGLGEFDDEELQAAGMAPVTKQTMQTAPVDITEPITEGAQDKVDSRAVTDLKDLQQEEQFLYNERPSTIVAETRTEESSSPGGNGGMLMLVLAVGVAWALYA